MTMLECAISVSIATMAGVLISTTLGMLPIKMGRLSSCQTEMMVLSSAMMALSRDIASEAQSMKLEPAQICLHTGSGKITWRTHKGVLQRLCGKGKPGTSTMGQGVTLVVDPVPRVGALRGVRCTLKGRSTCVSQFCGMTYDK